MNQPAEKLEAAGQGIGEFPGQHKCAVDGCPVQIQREKIMCPRHWYMCPVERQKAVLVAAQKHDPKKFAAASQAAAAAVSKILSFKS